MRGSIEYQRWLRRIDDSEALRNQFKTDDEANYKAVFGDSRLVDGSRTGVNSSTSTKDHCYTFAKLSAYIKTMIADLVLYRPEVFLTASEKIEKENPQVVDIVQKYQDELNRVLQDMDGYEVETQSCLIDSECSHVGGVIKVIAEPVLIPNPFSGQSFQLSAQGKPILEPAEVLDTVIFSVRRVDPHKYLIDSKCTNDLNNARWKGEEIDRNLQELLDSGLYDSKLLSNIRQKHIGKDKEDWEIEVKLYEIYDKAAGKLLCLCKEVDDFLRIDDIPETIDGFPYIEIQIGNIIPGQCYQRPNVSNGRKIQEDLTEIRTWLRKQAWMSLPKIGFDKHKIEEAEVTKLTDGVSTVIELLQLDATQLLNTDFKSGQAITDYINTLEKDFDEIMGQSMQERGMSGEKEILATELEIAAASGKLRGSSRVNTVRNWSAAIMEKLLIAMKGSNYAKMAGLSIDIDMDVDVDIESQSAKNKAIERKQLIEAIGVVPDLILCPTVVEKLARLLMLRDTEKVKIELMQAQQAKAAAAAQANIPQPVKSETKGPSISVSFKGEALPLKAQNVILDKIMQTDVPMDTENPSSSPSLQPGGQPTAPGNSLPAPINKGLEGMEPGSGMLPSGEVV